MIASTLKHDMAGSAGDWTGLYIEKFNINIKTVSTALTVNAYNCRQYML